ncbi:restriction endonuclease [Mycobacterium lacus]|uniref:Restriction system protein n=1 Tax=Mycobacterium lacus TaxID=169765 RepID=A0A1X1Y937_9MYCO|nr:restriction endonuclease [Mycobacterium lacus]MCV7121759.1 restriction endonuclease [Mycobacterium lacus]ORW07520.1 restriction endonuclease [Mycobacterium lacus]BBX95938.1 restriction system protein [Mycobacterium lacus]
MTIPDFQTLMRPILAYLADGQAKSTKDVIAAMSDEFGLSDDERAQMLPSGRQKTMYDRVNWSLTHMSQAGLLDRPTRGHVQLSDAGRQVLNSHPDRVDVKILREFPSYIAFRERMNAKQSTEAAHKNRLAGEEQVSPEDLIDAALAENRAAVEGEILKKALALSPTGFEDLVIRLLEAMGYGRAGAAERTSASGDAGVDGIISQDPLGLDRIYVQAKRYAVDQTIGRPKIHEFAGALLGKQGDRGVYITTSSFSRGAREEAERINARIELIDGGRLAELLVRYGVGVQTVQKVELLRLDEDFFDGL